MKKITLLLLFISACFLQNMNAQNTQPDNIPSVPAFISLNGPRVGVTQLVGDEIIQRAKDKFNLNPTFSQFGWQFEKRLFFSKTGTAALVEVIPLIGGLDQNKFLPSLNLILGMRSRHGLEIGVGPNIVPSKNTNVVASSMVVATGLTLKFEDFFIPINLAYAMTQGGGRGSIMIGFNFRNNPLP